MHIREAFFSKSVAQLEWQKQRGSADCTGLYRPVVNFFLGLHGPIPSWLRSWLRISVPSCSSEGWRYRREEEVYLNFFCALTAERGVRNFALHSLGIAARTLRRSWNNLAGRCK